MQAPAQQTLLTYREHIESIPACIRATLVMSAGMHLTNVLPRVMKLGRSHRSFAHREETDADLLAACALLTVLFPDNYDLAVYVADRVIAQGIEHHTTPLDPLIEAEIELICADYDRRADDGPHAHRLVCAAGCCGPAAGLRTALGDVAGAVHTWMDGHRNRKDRREAGDDGEPGPAPGPTHQAHEAAEIVLSLARLMGDERE